MSIWLQSTETGVMAVFVNGFQEDVGPEMNDGLRETATRAEPSDQVKRLLKNVKPNFCISLFHPSLFDVYNKTACFYNFRPKKNQLVSNILPNKINCHKYSYSFNSK